MAELLPCRVGLVGLAISYVLSMTGLLNGVVTYFTETEKQMVSVERIDQYISDVPEECQAESVQVLSPSFCYITISQESWQFGIVITS